MGTALPAVWTAWRGASSILSIQANDLPRGPLSILADQIGSNIHPVRLPHFFYFVDGFSRGSLRCILRSKAAVSFEYGVIGAADFVKERHGGSLPSGNERFMDLIVINRVDR